MGMFANNDRKKSTFEEFLDNYPVPAVDYGPIDTAVPAPGSMAAPTASNRAINPYEPMFVTPDTSTRLPVGSGFYSAASPSDEIMKSRPETDGNAMRIAGLTTPLVKAMAKAHPEIVSNTQIVLRKLTGGRLSDRDMSRLTDHVMNNVSAFDIPALSGVKPSIPLLLNRKSAAVVEQLINSLPNDELGNRIRKQYHLDRATGSIRIGK